MAVVMRVLIVSLALLGTSATSTSNNLDPIAKVLMMLDDLYAKVKAAGEKEEKAFKEFFDWCDDAASEAKNAITTATKDKEKQEATIAKSKATIEDCTTAIEELAAAIAKAEKELEEATAIREK